MTTPNAGEDAEKLEHSLVAGSNVKWYSHSGKQFGTFFKKLDMQLLYYAGNDVPDIYPREMKPYVPTKTCTQMFTATLFVKAPNWKQPECPASNE